MLDKSVCFCAAFGHKIWWKKRYGGSNALEKEEAQGRGEMLEVDEHVIAMWHTTQPLFDGIAAIQLMAMPRGLSPVENTIPERIFVATGIMPTLLSPSKVENTFSPFGEIATKSL
jgi:hypothetical protein